jgi:hypothetical protein
MGLEGKLAIRTKRKKVLVIPTTFSTAISSETKKISRKVILILSTDGFTNSQITKTYVVQQNFTFPSPTSPSCEHQIQSSVSSSRKNANVDFHSQRCLSISSPSKSYRVYFRIIKTSAAYRSSRSNY